MYKVMEIFTLIRRQNGAKISNCQRLQCRYSLPFRCVCEVRWVSVQVDPLCHIRSLCLSSVYASCAWSRPSSETPPSWSCTSHVFRKAWDWCWGQWWCDYDAGCGSQAAAADAAYSGYDVTSVLSNGSILCYTHKSNQANHYLCIGYNSVWSALCECIRANSLQTVL